MQSSNNSLGGPASSTFDLINSRFPDESHPHGILERRINDLARSDDVVLEIGNRSFSPALRKPHGFVGAVRRVDRINMSNVANASIDIAFCRCMAAPVDAINRYYSDLFRTLRPGGFFVFLAPNYWGFEQMLSRFFPHQFDRSVTVAPGACGPRHAEPMRAPSNTARSIKRLANDHGFTIEQLDYLNQSPSISSVDRGLSAQYAAMLTHHPMFRYLRGHIMGTLKKKFMRDLI